MPFYNSLTATVSARCCVQPGAYHFLRASVAVGGRASVIWEGTRLYCRSFDIDRLNVALLIAAIAMLLLWIVGVLAKKQEHHVFFQANTVRHRNVLSTFSIGWQCLKRR